MSGPQHANSPANSPTGAPAGAPRGPLGVLLLAGDHVRAHYALVVATGAAAIGREVVLFVSDAGCQLFRRESPLLADPREAALAARGVADIATLLDAAVELGVRRIACEAGLRAVDLPAEALCEGVEIAGIATFLAAVGSGQVVSF